MRILTLFPEGRFSSNSWSEIPGAGQLGILALATSVALGQASAQETVEPKLALVIGISDYRSPQEAGLVSPPDLRNATRDADLVAGALEGKGFIVSRVSDTTKAQLVAALMKFRADLAGAGSDAVGLVYFAGHGAQGRSDPRSTVDNYLIPADAQLRNESDLPKEAISLRYISQLLTPPENGALVLILDACRDFGLPGIDGSGTAPEGWAEIDAEIGTFIAYATSPGKTALDSIPGAANGPYALALATEIRAAQSVPIDHVFMATRNRVLQQTAHAQVPWENSSLRRPIVIGEDCAVNDFGSTSPLRTKISVSIEETRRAEQVATSRSQFRCALVREVSGALTASRFFSVQPAEAATYHLAMQIVAADLSRTRTPLPNFIGKSVARLEGPLEMLVTVRKRTGEIQARFPIRTYVRTVGTTVDSASSVPKDSDAQLAEAATKVATRLSLRLLEELYPTQVVRREGANIYLNRGQDYGYRLGQRLEIFKQGARLIDPITGEDLGATLTIVGTARVLSLFPRVTAAEITSETEPMAQGMIARRASEEQ